jgi:hypothetical protein
MSTPEFLEIKKAVETYGVVVIDSQILTMMIKFASQRVLEN